MNEQLREALSDQALTRYDEDLDLLITWNGSSGFNVYSSDGESLDTFTVYGKDTNAGSCTPAEALEAIEAHLVELRVEFGSSSYGVEP